MNTVIHTLPLRRRLWLACRAYCRRFRLQCRAFHLRHRIAAADNDLREMQWQLEILPTQIAIHRSQIDAWRVALIDCDLETRST